MTDDRPIAYLTGDYPTVSHTFILREIAAVRAAGVAVLVSPAVAVLAQPATSRTTANALRRASFDMFAMVVPSDPPGPRPTPLCSR